MALNPKGGSNVSLEHAEDGFDLPTMAMGVLPESVFHQFTGSPTFRVGFAVVLRSPVRAAKGSTVQQDALAVKRNFRMD